MPWITIIEADLLTAISGPELAGFRDAALADGQADPVAPTIAQVIELVRGYVGACKNNSLGPTGTIPKKLLPPALDLIAVRIPGRVGKSPKAGRKDAAEAATTLLQQVAKCMFDIEEPIEFSAEQPVTGTGRPSFSGRRRRNVRGEHDGI